MWIFSVGAVYDILWTKCHLAACEVSCWYIVRCVSVHQGMSGDISLLRQNWEHKWILQIPCLQKRFWLFHSSYAGVNQLSSEDLFYNLIPTRQQQMEWMRTKNVIARPDQTFLCQYTPLIPCFFFFRILTDKHPSGHLHFSFPLQLIYTLFINGLFSALPSFHLQWKPSDKSHFPPSSIYQEALKFI